MLRFQCKLFANGRPAYKSTNLVQVLEVVPSGQFHCVMYGNGRQALKHIVSPSVLSPFYLFTTLVISNYSDLKCCKCHTSSPGTFCWREQQSLGHLLVMPLLDSSLRGTARGSVSGGRSGTWDREHPTRLGSPLRM